MIYFLKIDKDNTGAQEFMARPLDVDHSEGKGLVFTVIKDGNQLDICFTDDEAADFIQWLNIKSHKITGRYSFPPGNE